MTFETIIFDPSWSYRSECTGSEFICGVIPGKLLYVKVNGSITAQDIDPWSNCLVQAFSSGYLDDTEHVRISDYTALEGVPVYNRVVFANGIRNIYEKHRCRPLFTLVVGADSIIRQECRMMAGTVNWEYGFVKDLASAFDVLNCGDFEKCKEHAEDIVLSSRHIVEFNEKMGLLLFGSGNHVEEGVGRVSEDNPLSFAIEALEVAQEDIRFLNHETCHAQGQLEEAHDGYRQILDSLSEAVYVLDEQGIILDVNKGAERMYGYTREELLGQSPASLGALGKNDLAKIKDYISAAIEAGVTNAFDFWAVRKNGDEFLKEVILTGGGFHGRKVVIATARDVTESKKNQLILKDTEERLRMILENTMVLILHLDGALRVVFVNRVVENMLGYAAEELMHRTISEFLPQASVDLLLSKVLISHKTHEPQRFEGQILHKDGRVIDLEILGKAFDRDGEMLVQVTARDISKRKLNERKIEYQSNFRHLIMDLASTFINIPLDQTEVAINHALESLCQFLGADRSYIFDYDFNRGVTSNTYEYCAGGIDPQIEDLQDVDLDVAVDFVAPHREGKMLEITELETLPEESPLRALLEQQRIKSLIAVPMMIGDHCIGFVGFDSVRTPHIYTEDEKDMIKVFAQMLGNVHERVLYEQNQTKLSKAIEQNPTTIIITDKDGCIEYVNSAGVESSGYTSGELIGQRPSVFKSGQTPPEVYDELWKTISRGETWKGELLNRKKNNELLWENLTISPILNSKREVTHYVAVKEDVTDRKQMIRDLEEAKEVAEQSDQLKSAFLANMSHEIRTPLNGILGFASLLDYEELDGPSFKEYAEIIQHSGNHLLNVINNIIHLSKLDAGYIKVVLEPVDVSSLLGELHEVFEEQIRCSGSHVELILERPQDELVAVTDITRLRQILENLLGNALKFTAQGTIKYGVEVLGQQLHFFVEDTGIGIPQDKLDVVFERFTQANDCTEKLYGGTGLGLPICKSCAQMLGGDLGVESTFGKGSKFYFSIDFVPLEQHESASGGEKDDPLFSGQTILVAEDDDLSFKLLERVLTVRNLKVERTTTGKQTLDKILRDGDKIDLLLLDIGMPEMDGLEATHLIRECNTTLPIIAQTAFALENDRDKCLGAGCNDYLSKPIAPQLLLDTISRWL